MRIEDYAIIGDTHSVALVSRSGSIDWLCLPRFDSAACFAALLGEPEHGRFSIAPVAPARATRRYRGESLVLETELDTPEGKIRIVDGMPIRGHNPDVVRIVEGVDGAVRIHVELVIRFEYGSVVPLLETVNGRLRAVAGPDALIVSSPIALCGDEKKLWAEVTVRKGDCLPFFITWHLSYEPLPEPVRPLHALAEAEKWWCDWAARAHICGSYRDQTLRSLLTLKALSYAPAGSIVAAPTTSLPETVGGVRNWDYRCCWLRDSTFTLFALMHAGYTEEAKAWCDWLVRAVAGDPGRLQTVYGPTGSRELHERTLDWLPGYDGSSPVRVGTRAAGQLQLDVYGEVLNTQHWAARLGLPRSTEVSKLLVSIGSWLAANWRSDDHGLWEIHGEPRAYVHSKVMTWVAIDRLVDALEHGELEGRSDDLRRLRAEIHRDVCDKGFDHELRSFTQSYGSKVIDASALLIPIVGFLPADDPRVLGTIDAVERELLHDGFVRRYITTDGPNDVDRLPGREGAFIACTFWLVNALALAGRRDQARALFERAVRVANDVGLLSEEYDVERECLLGNFPQALSHLALVNAARVLEDCPIDHHRQGG